MKNIFSSVSGRVGSGIFALMLTVGLHCIAQTPAMVAQWPGGNRGPVQAVQVRSNLAYCAIAEGGLAIVNVGSRTNASWVGGYDTSGSAIDVAVAGNLAFVAGYTAGLQIIDVTDPANPSQIGSYTNCDRLKGIAVFGNYAFLADGTNGLQIIDVTLPSNPLRVGGYAPTNGFGEGIAVAGNYAYLAMGAAGLFVIDVSNPPFPINSGSYDTTGYAQRVAISGNVAYVADGIAGLQIIDVSNPAAPTRVGGYFSNAFVQGVAAAGTNVYVGDSDGVQVINVSNPANPILIGTCGTRDWVAGMAIDGNFVYLAAQATLDIIDVSTPSVPVRVGDFNTGGYFAGIAVRDNVAYVADSSAGVYVLDISNPTNAVVINEIEGRTWNVSVADDRLYLANEAAGGQIFSISNPAVPIYLGGFDTTGHVYSVSGAGNFAYAADDHGGMKIFDVTTPASPLLSGSTSNVVTGVAGVGTYAYVAAGTFQIFDTSVPSSPVRRYLSGTIGAESLMIKGQNAYLACGTNGVQRFDISTPANAVKTAGYQYASGFSAGILAISNRVYACEGTNGFDVFDDTNPTSWTTPANYNTKGFAEKVALANNYALVADGSNGLIVLRVAGFSGEAPRIVASPSSRTVPTNGSTVFRVSVQGTEPLTYQWRRNGTDLPGATLSTLALTNVTSNDVGDYSVFVLNGNGSASSSPALLDILRAPQIDSSGTNAPVRTGNTFRLGFLTQPSVTYAVEYKNDFNQSWQLLGYTAGDGNVAGITNSSATSPYQFYRLRIP